MAKKTPEWAPEVDLTDALQLKDVSVASLESDDDARPITTYMAILKFRSVMYVDHRMLDHEAVSKTMLDTMRPDLLRCMFDYLVEHDSGDLRSLIAKTEAETIHKMISQNPLGFPVRG